MQGIFFDQDDEFSGNKLGGEVSRHRLLFEGHSDPVCGFGNIFANELTLGFTFADMFDYEVEQTFFLYAYSGACPPECESANDCTQAFAQCVDGQCMIER